MGIIQAIIHAVFGGLLTVVIFKLVLIVLGVLIGCWGIVALCDAIGRKRDSQTKKKES